MNIIIDEESGFCFGVRRAIDTAELKLAEKENVYCIGDIVHNEREIERLQQKGLKVISVDDMKKLSDVDVMFRAHGEPPTSYAIVEERKLTLTDATCPMVLSLQKRIRSSWEKQKTSGGQIVIFGKKGHAEVIGLVGQTNNECILIETIDDIHKIDFSKPIEIFAQTTKDPEQYALLIEAIKSKSQSDVIAHNTICTQMAGRANQLRKFAKEHDVLFFVGGAKSSNSKVLFEIAKNSNKYSFFLTSEDDLDNIQIPQKTGSIGIFGATSTPLWLMQNIKLKAERIYNN
ncbi:MAG: 4-hydroxy-3-methylbut-2-enyl diphosphate reductase [Bacteroidales bacterium]|jgi:4-hydroxy-3-methylbut-2-enyl diphosphate reductase|nr:4-hydroxy-3-methylbut-2-enyl diphosphate reductase [Bacteroidales bacterium]